MTRILVVEDEGIVRKDVAERLRYLGYEVCGEASSSAEALAGAKQLSPDLVLMDIMLRGERDGISCAGEIHGALGIPVVYLTAYADPQTLAAAKVTEPFGYILKPFEERDLQSVIEMALYKARMDSERKKDEAELAESYRKLKETQEQLIHSSKMTAMGQLAAGISHELNQPLTGIKGFAQAAMLDCDKSSRIYSDLSTIVQQCERMEIIINSVRSFGRKSSQTIEQVDINAVINEMLKLVKTQLTVHNIRLETSLAPGLPAVMGNAGQLQQVFINLITNARDALEGRKGEGAPAIRIFTREDGKGGVEAQISDNGCGISEENLEHIFNPFYTTKAPGGGMGLGLSIVYSIVESHKGSIKVESTIGSGTTFRINLPASR